MKTALALACLFALVVAWEGDAEAAAGAWPGLTVIALTPLVLWSLLKGSSGRDLALSSVDLEALAWAQAGSDLPPPRNPWRGLRIGAASAQPGRSMPAPSAGLAAST